MNNVFFYFKFSFKIIILNDNIRVYHVSNYSRRLTKLKYLSRLIIVEKAIWKWIFTTAKKLLTKGRYKIWQENCSSMGPSYTLFEVISDPARRALWRDTSYIYSQTFLLHSYNTSVYVLVYGCVGVCVCLCYFPTSADNREP